MLRAAAAGCVSYVRPPAAAAAPLCTGKARGAAVRSRRGSRPAPRRATPCPPLLLRLAGRKLLLLLLRTGSPLSAWGWQTAGKRMKPGRGTGAGEGDGWLREQAWRCSGWQCSAAARGLLRSSPCCPLHHSALLPHPACCCCCLLTLLFFTSSSATIGRYGSGSGEAEASEWHGRARADRAGLRCAPFAHAGMLPLCRQRDDPNKQGSGAAAAAHR